MQIEHPLPIDPSFVSSAEYVQSLLSFITSSDLFQTLCGGVHILDFLTKQPDLYSAVLPLDWREWFQLHDLPTILDLFLREDNPGLQALRLPESSWRHCRSPPASLLDYVITIRRHALKREFKASTETGAANALPRHIAVGMKPKKIHEVQNLAKYIDHLSTQISSSSPHDITHAVDFGSGQNYLGRALASPPYKMNVAALESKSLNISGAKTMDVTAKIAEKEKIMRNKKLYRRGWNGEANPLNNSIDKDALRGDPQPFDILETPNVAMNYPRGSGIGKVQYIERFIRDGELSDVMCRLKTTIDPQTPEPHVMVVSLHSCGNLLHHGLRSLILNPLVKAVAMVGCCYNLVTERLGPPTYKLPSLRTSNQRLDATSSACDPHGFPMSEHLATYKHRHGEGIRMNITARMMAVQAPQNWTEAECESFFTRHFYRSLLQKIFLDRGVVTRTVEYSEETGGGGSHEWPGTGPAITIGSLRKKCYHSFPTYVRAAVQKLAENHEFGHFISDRMHGLTDEEITLYEHEYATKKKNLSIVWSLMAFSATVVESAIVVDRWLYLREQAEVRDCWVEAVFDYSQSPRNLAVVGIKR